MKQASHDIGGSFRAGTAFDASAGKLYEFDEDSVTVMAAWPRMQAWWRSTRHPAWCGCRPQLIIPDGRLDDSDHQRYADREPDGQLLLPFAVSCLHRRRAAIAGFCSRIPLEVRDAVRPFGDRHWHLSTFIARCGPAALDLTRSNPALAYMLASSWAFRERPVARPLRSARALLGRGRRQREVFEWLAWPGTDATRRVVRKIAPASARTVSLRCLRSRLTEPAIVKALRHVPRINANVMRMAWDRSLLQVTPQVLAEAGDRQADDGYPEFALRLREALRMWTRVHPERPLPVFRQFEAVDAMHDELSVVLRSEPDAPLGVVLPPPPVAGTDTIQALATADMMRDEGRTQHNCVASFCVEAAEGRMAFYRVLAPERATVSLVRERDGWRIGQIKTAANRPAKRRTWLAVQRWLADAAGLGPDPERREI
jgi:hypothetical protein